MKELTIFLVIAILMVPANFVIRLAMPGISKRRHILLVIFTPGILLWLLVSMTVIGAVGSTPDRWTVIGVSAIALLTISAVIGLPITYLLLKITRWFE